MGVLPVIPGLRIVSALVAAAFSVAGSADVPAIIPDRSLAAADASAYDVFGYGLGFDGTTLLVGSRGTDTPQVNSGSIYAFRRVGGAWTQVQKLVFTTAVRDDQVGTAVAVAGTAAVAGAPGRGAGGAAFILRFDGGTWFSQAEVSDPAAGSGAAFGAAVACSGDIVAIGAPGAAESVGAGAGRVRTYDRNGQVWVQGEALRAPFPDPGDQFGSALALSGDLIAVGAPGDDDRAVNSGAVYVFRRSGGTFQLVQKVFPPVSAAEDFFGRSVSLAGGLLVVGAYRSDLAAADAGAAFVYSVSGAGTCSHLRTLLPPAGAVDAGFGNSVGTDGISVIVGAPGFAPASALHGASWIYLDGDSVPEARLASVGTGTMDLCGTRVAIAPAAAVSGAPGAQVALSPSAGTVHLFDRLRDCDASGVPDAIELANGTLGDANGDGTPDACQCIGDFTGDNVVNGGDLAIMLGVWGVTPPAFPLPDLDRNGQIDGADLAALLGAWGACP